MVNAIQRNIDTLLTTLGWSMIEETGKEQSIKPLKELQYIDPPEPRIDLRTEVPCFQRPTLSPPDTSSKPFQKALIQLLDDVELSRTKTHHMDSTRLHLNTSELQAIQEKRIANIHDTALKAQSVDNWAFLQQVASTLFGAASILTGVALISTGKQGVGSMMVGAGVSSVVSILLSEMAVDNRITGAIALSSAAMSLLCGGLNFDILATHLPRLMLTIISGVINIMNGVALFGKQYTESELTWLKSEKHNFDMMLTRSHREAEEIQDDAKRASRQLAFTKEAAHLLNDQQREITTITSTVV